MLEKGEVMFEKILVSLISRGIIAGAKGIYNNTGERKKQKELDAQIEHYQTRGFFVTLITYGIGYAICFWMITLGIWGAICVLLGILGQYQKLSKLKTYIVLTREYVFTTIISLAIIATFLFTYI